MTILAKTYFCTHYSIFEVFLLFYHGKTRFFFDRMAKTCQPWKRSGATVQPWCTPLRTWNHSERIPSASTQLPGRPFTIWKVYSCTSTLWCSEDQHQLKYHSWHSATRICTWQIFMTRKNGCR